MKTNKNSRTKTVNALIWATVLLAGSFLLKSVEGNEQLISFLILAIGINISLFLNGATKWSCKTKG